MHVLSQRQQLCGSDTPFLTCRTYVAQIADTVLVGSGDGGALEEVTRFCPSAWTDASYEIKEESDEAEGSDSVVEMDVDSDDDGAGPSR